MEIPPVRTNVYQCVYLRTPCGWRRWYFLVSWKSGRTEMIEIKDEYPIAIKILIDRLGEEMSDDPVEEILLAPNKDWTN